LKRTLAGLLLFALLIGVFVSTYKIQLANAQTPTIYINADGSITPSTSPIYTADNITYTLTGNITVNANGILIERNNTILNGEGYTVTGSGNGNGTTLANMGNVTINNMTITNFTNGIWLNSSTNSTLSGNNVTDSEFGIYLESSSNDLLTGNKVTANIEAGIYLLASSNNVINENIATANEVDGIDLYSSSDNIISSNNFTANGPDGGGIDIGASSNNTVSGNTVTANNRFGISLVSGSGISSGNTLSGNNVTNNGEGISLNSSSDNIFSDNVMVSNEYNFGVLGNAFSEFLQSVDTSNLVDGKPVYYFVNQSNIMMNPEAYSEVGYLGFVDCVNVTVQGMNLTNNGQGILLAYTNDSEITGNNAANNGEGIELYSSTNSTVSSNSVTNSSIGILLWYSGNNTLSGNNFTASQMEGIWLSSSSTNAIYHNNFVNNVYQVNSYDSTNTWDNGSTGNYWSDYLTRYPNATETDGVWNTPYVIDSNNTDYYPLTVPIAVIPEFPSFLILPLFMIATLLAVIIYKKKAIPHKRL
jgi:parallel beta-helix repeat protein